MGIDYGHDRLKLGMSPDLMMKSGMVTHLDLKKNIIRREPLSTFQDFPGVLLDLKMLPFVFHPLHELLEARPAAGIGERGFSQSSNC